MANIRIITARYAGKDATGRAFKRGAQIAWDPRTRTVVSADPTRITEIQADQPAREPFIDLDRMYEDECARRCGL